MLFEELSIIIGGELSDPHLSLVAVTDLIISQDLRNAKVFVFSDDDEVSNSEVLRALKRAVPYMRAQIAERCGLRMVPDITFSYDDTPQKAGRIEALFAQIASEQQEDTENSDVVEAEENPENNPESSTGVETGP
jgi:ribosome-binding factor A